MSVTVGKIDCSSITISDLRDYPVEITTLDLRKDNNDTTIGKALEDYDYGFYTTRDADSGDVLVGTYCSVCEDEFFQVKTEDVKLADCICDKCKDKFETYISWIRHNPAKYVSNMYGIRLTWYQRVYLSIYSALAGFKSRLRCMCWKLNKIIKYKS